MGEARLVTYLVVTHHRPDYLPGSLESIRAQQHRPIQIIVVDNGGDLTDSIFEPLRGEGVETVLVSPGSNLGAMEGRNAGLSVARGEVVVFVDDDQPLNEADATLRLLAMLDADPRCGAVAYRCVNPQGQTLLNQLPHSVRRDPVGVGVVEVPSFLEGQIAIRRSLLEQIGGYPSRFFYCMGSYDLALRILDAGYTILYNPAITATHYKAQQGRVVGIRGQHRDRPFHCNLNRTRAALRLLPFPYNLSVTLVRFCWMLLASGFDLRMAARYVRTLIGEREWLCQGRHPISRQTVRYLLSIGGWTMLI